MYSKPHIVEFPKIGNSDLGYISIAEKNSFPFVVKRIYWTYYTPENLFRGAHAHYELEQILLAVSGKIIVNTEMANGVKNEFILDDPSVGLFIPKLVWRTMKYSHNSVQMCIASMVYEENDYIREYSRFKELK